jgi:hypothetical protein
MSAAIGDGAHKQNPARNKLARVKTSIDFILFISIPSFDLLFTLIFICKSKIIGVLRNCKIYQQAIFTPLSGEGSVFPTI